MNFIRRIAAPAFLLVVALCLLVSCNRVVHAVPEHPKRIIAFAPSITETIYALGAQSLLVGVTDFCTWPENVSEKPSVGGYTNPSYERILSLHPDCVITLREHDDLNAFLDKSGIASIRVPNDNLGEILKSFVTIGKLCGREKQADSIVAFVNGTMVGHDVPESQRPRVMLVVGRDNPGSGSVTSVWAAGPATFYSELIEAAGGRCAVKDSLPRYPSIGIEGIAAIDPDIIVDISSASIATLSPQACTADWKPLTMLRAVRENEVASPPGRYFPIPGPRIGNTIADLREIIENWKKIHGRAS